MKTQDFIILYSLRIHLRTFLGINVIHTQLPIRTVFLLWAYIYNRENSCKKSQDHAVTAKTKGD